jgi:chemotaxis protein MotB
MIRNLNFSKIAIVAACAISMTGCVARKRFDDLTANKVKLEAEKAECDTKLAQATEDLKQLNAQLKELGNANSLLVNDTATTGQAYRKTKQLYNELNDTYEKLLKNHNRMLSNSAAEAGRLNQDLVTREKELLAIEQNLQEMRNQNQQLNDDLKLREQRVSELEKVLADKEKAVNDLKARVSNALLSFKEKDLTVNVRNGKVYVSLSDQLLFKSGSYAVDKAGLEAIKKLAPILKENDDISVLVEGHTDDVPVNRNTACIADNWDLSVLRATSIVRTLTKEGVSGVKLSASGRAANAPLEAAKTADARQKNRRTEIILTPRLDELFQILEN